MQQLHKLGSSANAKTLSVQLAAVGDAFAVDAILHFSGTATRFARATSASTISATAAVRLGCA